MSKRYRPDGERAYLDAPLQSVKYLNVDIVNGTLVDISNDPVINFSETRSSKILEHANRYLMSIVRFSMDGCGKAMPMFIPTVEGAAVGSIAVTGSNNVFFITTGTTGIQVVVPVATYTSPAAFLLALNTAMAAAIAGSNFSSATATINPSGFIVFKIAWTVYLDGVTLGLQTVFSPDAYILYGMPPNIPYQTGGNATFMGTSAMPFSPPAAYDTVYSMTLMGNFYIGSKLPAGPIQVFIPWIPEFQNTPIPYAGPGAPVVQDPAHRYWWCTSYAHWVNCVNAAFVKMWAVLTGSTQANAMVATLPPVLQYNPSTGLFSIGFDSNGFGDNRTSTYNNLGQWDNRTSTYTNLGLPGITLTSPINQDQRLRFSSYNENFTLFFNGNMAGLFANFNMLYTGCDSYYGMDYLVVASNENVKAFDPWGVQGAPGPPATVDNVNVIVRHSGDATVDPDYPGGVIPFNQVFPRQLFVVTQDYESTSTLWSPVASIVFTSALLPTLPELTGPPNTLLAGNNNANASTAAFNSIITDITLDRQSARDYRGFVSYVPSGEYRMTSLGTSDVDLNQMDFKVWWKHRLTGQLVPLHMYNGASVHLKIMFRLEGAGR